MRCLLHESFIGHRQLSLETGELKGKEMPGGGRYLFSRLSLWIFNRMDFQLRTPAAGSEPTRKATRNCYCPDFSKALPVGA
jgi:hypothetical protein